MIRALSEVPHLSVVAVVSSIVAATFATTFVFAQFPIDDSRW